MDIEKKIKPLVEILNEVPYIRTTSNCEGHFDSDEHLRHSANVIFEVEASYEKEIENLAYRIMEITEPNWFNRSVEFYKRFFKSPSNPSLDINWVIEIQPIDGKTPPSEKRSYADEAIAKITLAVKKYLQDYS